MGNQQGKERRDYERKIDWKNAERPSPPGKPYLVPEETDRPTDVITIRWSPPVSDGGAPILGYLVEHRRTGSPHWLRATPDLVLSTELPLTGLEPGWRYQFRISAENGVGWSDPGELSEPLTVTSQKWAASAPFFNVELQDTIGLENEKVEFKVQVIAIPPPTIAWYKDGFEVFSSRRTKIITENDQSTFIIHQAALEDEGEIKCTATNRAGHAVTKANLKLEAPPRIRLPRQYEDGLIFERGELIRLKVTAAGRPPPEVLWFHNGELLRKNERTEITISETSSVVKIRDACRNDRGEYIIKGVNKIGDDIVSFLVTVTDRPSPPGKIQIITFGRTVTLSWSSPEDDGGCKIGSYIVEYFRVGWDMWLKAKNSRQLSTILEDLIEGSEYKFRVRAENPYGISDPSEESDVIFIPDPKRCVIKPPLRQTTSELIKETKKHSDNIEETEESKRRRLLEEKARTLLDTPLSVLLPYENSMEKPQNEESNRENIPPPVPKRRKAKGRLTPSPVDVSSINQKIPQSFEEGVNNSRRTPSPIDPKLSDVTFMTEEKINGVVEMKEQREKGLRFMEQDPFAGEGPMYPRENDDSIMHGSSELMLVIYPRDRSKSIELSARQRSEIEMNLTGEGIAPPMSLSAPELGCTEIFEPFMRNAVSSTELLYEKTAARLYQDCIDEEAQRLVVKRRYSMDRKSVERRTSLKEPLERRLSFKGNQEEERNKTQTETSEELAKNHPTKQLQSNIPKLNGNNGRERLSSVERERLEFAMVRDRLKQKEEEKNQKMIFNGSETPTTATSSSLETEELEDEYEDDSLEEEEDEDYLDENKKEKNDDYDDTLDIKTEISKILILDTSLPKPVRIAPFAELEDDTYHPRSMIPTRSVITKLPTEDVKTSLNASVTPAEVMRPSSPTPSEIKTEKLLLEDDTYHPRSMIPTRSVITKLPTEDVKTSLNASVTPAEVMRPSSPTPSEIKTEKLLSERKTSKIPIPKAKKTSKIFKKLCLKKDREIPEVTVTPADQDSPPTVLPKPILKNKTPVGKRKETPKTLLKFGHYKSSEKFVSEEESEGEFTGKKKKQVRIAEPTVETLNKEKPVDENAIENLVLIYHYSDIVKEFGGNKKPPAKLYLNYDELKAHARELEKVNSVPHYLDNNLDNRPSLPGTELIRNEKTPEIIKPEMQSPESEVINPQNPKPGTKTHSSLEYLTDVTMFIIACCLYLFKNELYAIPVLVVMAYRQLKDMTVTKYENFKKSLTKKIPKNFKRKAKKEDEKNS